MKEKKSEYSQADLIDVVSQELFSTPHYLFLKDGLFFGLKTSSIWSQWTSYLTQDA